MRWKIIAIQGLVILALGGICFGAYNKINSLREEISAAYTKRKEPLSLRLKSLNLVKILLIGSY